MDGEAETVILGPDAGSDLVAFFWMWIGGGDFVWEGGKGRLG